MTPRLGQGGYLTVNLRIDGKCHYRKVHRVVLESFVGKAPTGTCCCHNDGNPRNNRLENLRWDSFKANATDTIKHRRTNRGSAHYNALVSDEDAAIILRLCLDGESKSKLARRFGVSRSVIANIANPEKWKDITPADQVPAPNTGSDLPRQVRELASKLHWINGDGAVDAARRVLLAAANLIVRLESENHRLRRKAQTATAEITAHG